MRASHRPATTSEPRATLTHMCASYGLDPRFTTKEYSAFVDEQLLEQLRAWAKGNAGETLLPTGRIKKNLNPIMRDSSTLELAWWGYLVDGRPSKFPSINSRSETLETRFKARPLPARAIVPASHWRERQKPSKQWFDLALPGDELLGMAAVLQRGRAENGTEYTCYSLVMQEAASHISDVHDRMPVLVPPDFAGEWLTSTAPAVELIDAARAAAFPLAERVVARPQGSTSAAAPALF